MSVYCTEAPFGSISAEDTFGLLFMVISNSTNSEFDGRGRLSQLKLNELMRSLYIILNSKQISSDV